MEKTLLTAAEAADELRVSASKIRDMCRSGELPAFRVGKSVRIPRAAVHDYFSRHFVGSPEFLGKAATVMPSVASAADVASARRLAHAAEGAVADVAASVLMKFDPVLAQQERQHRRAMLDRAEYLAEHSPDSSIRVWARDFVDRGGSTETE